MVWILVAYDITTDDKAGRKRLRRVSKVCERYGRRVQKSLFECQADGLTLETFRIQLVKEINEKEDSLRIYLFGSDIDSKLETYGVNETFHFDDPLIV